MEAGELDEAREVSDVAFPPLDESAGVVHPSEEPFGSPAFLVVEN